MSRRRESEWLWIIVVLMLVAPYFMARPFMSSKRGNRNVSFFVALLLFILFAISIHAHWLLIFPIVIGFWLVVTLGVFIHNR